MHTQKLAGLPVSRSDGVLLGLLRRDDAERALAFERTQPVRARGAKVRGRSLSTLAPAFAGIAAA